MSDEKWRELIQTIVDLRDQLKIGMAALFVISRNGCPDCGGLARKALTELDQVTSTNPPGDQI